MKLKTQVHANEGCQDLTVTREFNLPLEFLFKAYTDAELLAQWMGTTVIKLDCQPHGGYRFETRDKNGNVVFSANGTIHKFVPNKTIVRTFEMENSPFDVQLEFLEFESLTPETSKLTMHIVYRTITMRDQMLQLPFAQGINMAHNRLEEIFKTNNYE